MNIPCYITYKIWSYPNIIGFRAISIQFLMEYVFLASHLF